MTPYAKANDQYLNQRVMGASPEQLIALLLEGAQRFLAQAIQAMARKDLGAKGQATSRVLAIIEELTVRLNHEEGGELVGNLMRIYDWWGREIMEANVKLDPARLERISRQMGEMRQTWEQLHLKQSAGNRMSGFHAEDMVG